MTHDTNTRPDIKEVYLALIRTFPYYRRDVKDEGPFGFLVDEMKYYKMAIENANHLREQGIFVRGVGRLRSVLDTPHPSISTDPLFSGVPEHYGGRIVRKRGLLERVKNFFRGEPDIRSILTPHYPCVINAIPSQRCKYQVITSSLPGSLALVNEKETRMSLSMRIYPVGLASLRLGWYFKTEEDIEVGDIIDFLSKKEGVIEIRKRSPSRSTRYSIDELTKEYKAKFVDGLIGEERALPSWETTHSIVNLIKVDSLLGEGKIMFKENYDETLLPLLRLSRRPSPIKPTPENLGEKPDDIFLFGPKSFVLSMPTTAMCLGRIVRRWLMNLIELYSIQHYLIGDVERIKTSIDYSLFKDRYWLDKLKKGILPPVINDLFSVYKYLNLHHRPVPIKDEWNIRYGKMLKVMDRRDSINMARGEAYQLLQNVVKTSEEASEYAGRLAKKILNELTELNLPGLTQSNK